MLALAQPAAGEVVVTHKTIPIPLSNWGKEGVGISFANNGAEDLKLVLSSYTGFGPPANNLKAVNAAEGKGVVAAIYASALRLGTRIGPSAFFRSAACGGSHSCYSAVPLAVSFISTSTTRREVFGPWTGNPKTAYLGVRFVINGEFRYGWVRLTVSTKIPLRMSATITAYAYETVPNKFILAGETAGPTADLQLPANIQNQRGPSLGMLALGAVGMPLWRREGTSPSQ